MQHFLKDMEPAIWAGKKYFSYNRLVSPQLIRASFELAYMGYGHNLEILEEMGYSDIHYYINGDEKAKKRSSYVSQIIRFAKDESALKMLVCVKKQSKYVVCISIAGSGADINDWRDNLQLKSEGGRHKAYLKNARDFLNIINGISFDEVAEELGEKSLSMKDIISECSMPRSRFSIFITGHSKGAAIAQLLNHLLIDTLYVDRTNLFSILFASPSVVNGRFLHTPYRYPILNIQNADDPVTNYGSIAQLGVSMEFRLPYKFYDIENEVQQKCFNMIRTINGPDDWLITMHAIFSYIALLDSENSGFLKSFISQKIINNYIDSMEKYYEDIFGFAFNKEASAKKQTMIMSSVNEYGAMAFLKLLYGYAQKTHNLYLEKSPYRFFVEHLGEHELYIYNHAMQKQETCRFIKISSSKNGMVRTEKHCKREIIRGKYEKRIKLSN